MSTTDRLIEDLVDDLSPVRPVPFARLMLMAVALVLTQAAWVFALGLARADLAVGAPSAITVWRMLCSGAIALVAVAMALRARVPTRGPGEWPLAVLALGLVAVAVGWGLDLWHPSVLAPSLRVRLWKGLHCIAMVTAGGLPLLALMVFLLRRGATVRPEAAATAAGLAAAAAGGALWALACPIDDPVYAAFWYAAAFALITGIARVALPGVVRLRPRCVARETLRRRLVGR